ncbi:MAG: nitroreductase family deazaflavin-dependent oxidoreductase [Pseudonocardiales bacterium]|nr:nitroreductase family deazaflavin-dependent oxidoreductase [Pseudonocardiales bacterium]
MASRRAVQRWVEAYLLNPGMRSLIQAGLAPAIFALVETTGRRTGLRRTTPVTVARDGKVVWLVSEHGWRSGYVQNISARPQVRLKIGRTWHTGTATLLADDDAWARRKAMGRRTGWMGRADGIFFKAMATTPMTVRVDLDQ